MKTKMNLLRGMMAALALATTTGAMAQADSVRINEVVVTGTRSAASTRNLPVTVNVVGREALTEKHQTNILPTLSELVPGLFVTQRGMMGYGVSTGAAGGINMRGISAGTGQLLVLVDGHPQYQGVYGHSIADSYQTIMAERVEVVRGPASVLYGSNAMGGVINIVTRKPTDVDNTTPVDLNIGMGSYGTFQIDGSISDRYGKILNSTAIQYSRSDNHRSRMGFEQTSISENFKYDINDNWNAFANLNISRFASSNPGTVSSPMYEARQWILRGVASVGVDNHFANTNGRISIYHNWGDHKINDGYTTGGTPQTDFFRSKDALTGVSIYENFMPWTGARVTLGADYQHIYGHAYYTDITTDTIVTTQKRKMQSANEKMDEVAGYVDINQQITNWLSASAGVRYDWHSVAGDEWVPQFGIAIVPTDNSQLKATVSKGFRNPTVKDMYLYAVANDNLKPERLMNYEIAWKHQLANGHFAYGVNLFYIKGDNMIQTATVTLPDNSTKKMNINTGAIDNRGAEIEAAWNINSHWSVNTNHSYLHMKNHVLGAPQYKGYLGAHMHYGKWTASLGAQQICGLYTTAGTPNDKEESFCLVNANVGYQIHNMVRLWAKGENLLAQQYEINAGYPMPRATFMGGVSISF